MPGPLGSNIVSPGKSWRFRIHGDSAKNFRDVAYVKLAYDAPDELFVLQEGSVRCENRGWPFLEIHSCNPISRTFRPINSELDYVSRDERWPGRELMKEILVVNIDGQSRFTLPQKAREHLRASEDDELMLIGFDTYLELWRTEDYNAALESYYNEK